MQSDIAAAVEDATRVFGKLGHRLSPIAGGPPQLGAEWSTLGNLDLAGVYSAVLPAREGDITRAIVEGMRDAEQIDPASWDAMRRRARRAQPVVRAALQATTTC